MVRAAAKNHRNVLIICNPENYSKVINELKNSNSADGVSLDFRQKLALEAFEHTSVYDGAISEELHSRWIGKPEDFDEKEQQEIRLPNSLISTAHKLHTLRYGENGHQSAGLYICLLYTSPSPRDRTRSRMPSSA